MKTYNKTGIFVVFISLYVLSMSVSDYDTIQFRKFQDVIFRQHDEVIENTFIFACVKACMKSRPCLSFAFDNSSQSCYLYKRMLYNGVGETVDNQIGSNVYIFNTEDRNIALWKPTAQDSKAYSWGASLAVDGNYRTSSHNGQAGFGWWCITLESYYDIASVIIWNYPSYQYRLAPFKLHVSTNTPCGQNNLQSATLCYVNDGTTKHVYTVAECNQPSVSLKNVPGFYISLQGNYLHMKEVEVLVM